MNKILNLIEILKDVPKGTKLWSPVFGDCEFVKIKENGKSAYPIVCIVKIKGLTDSKEYTYFSAKGELCIDYSNTECILFPSKENRDWSTFKTIKKHKEFKPFEKVLRVDDCAMKSPDPWIKVWSCDFYSYYDKNTRTHYFVSGYAAKDDEVIHYEGNEDKLGKPVE